MNPYVNSLNGYGGGFIAFWPSSALEQIVDEVAGGSGHPTIIIYNRRQEPVEIERTDFEVLHQAVQVEKAKKRGKTLSKAAVKRVSKAMEAKFDATSNMLSYSISYQEALLRYRELILELIENMQNDDDEEAILFILMNL